MKTKNKAMTPADKHQLRIARKILNMPDAAASYFAVTSGHPTKEEAKVIIHEIQTKYKGK